MRKTNKKLKKLAADKYGVILVTVIFIVAMALVFITTALTISIATRQRVYTNAKYQQARLTVTSLAQSVWQAIYSQQISDRDLVSLAKGTGGNGTLVSFSTNDVPGMGMGGTVATAYFYCVTPGDPSKIGIEFKCDIDGATDGACQYYTMVLERHKGEDFPPAAFRLPLELGDGGDFQRCNVGLDVRYITNADRHQQVRYNDDDNICFLHGNTHGDCSGNAFYCTFITEGQVSMRDTVFAYEAYFLGPNASLDFSGGINQNNAVDNAYRTSPVTHEEQYGDLYFWGTNSPFTRNGAAISGSDTFGLSGINDIYFDFQDQDDGSHTGFSGFAGETLLDQNFRDISGGVHFESGVTPNSGGGATWTSHSAGWNPVTDNNMDSYLTVSTEEMNTVDKVVTRFGGDIAGATDLTSAYFTSNHSMSSGAYVLDGQTAYLADNTTITCDVSGGDIEIFLTNGAHLYAGGNNSYIRIQGSGEHKVIFVLCDGSQIHIGVGQYGARDNCGIYDSYVISSPHNVQTIDQSRCPRCEIYAAYSGGTPVRMEGNQNSVLTACLGFFPQSTPGAPGGGHLYVYNTNPSNVYYGRISAGGIDNASGNSFNVPYCPASNDGGPTRDYAYRDNTDFSVVMDECRYFTSNS